MTNVRAKAGCPETAAGLDSGVDQPQDLHTHAIIACDKNETLRSWSDAARRLCGYEAREIQGRPLSLLLPSRAEGADTGAEPLRLMMERALRDGFCQGMAAFRHKDGSTLLRPALVTPTRGEAGEATGFLIAAAPFDIAAAQETIQALRTRVKVFDALNQAKDRFLGRLLHDIRTPVGGITGFAATLLMRLPGPLTADQERQIGIIETCAQELLTQINGLPDALRIETGTIEPRLCRVSCRAVVQEVAREWRDAARSKGLTFETAIPDGEVVLRTDPRILEMILSRLVANAVLHTERGGVSVSCDRPAAGQREVAIRIADTGPGLSAEDQGKLFQPFTQLVSTAPRTRRGPGLGLYQARRLAGLVDGRVLCDSALGRGSVFSLVLPFGGDHGAHPGD
ncbi:PAS domain-containing sensor histidine kinase [Azospirillum agricola]|uniref:PAS domain-containing sensor histidine kinase n=1 Tax=Azospirillum agricola TaxID=1720247 RepID=UPI000A0F0166|nr:ATP-binding protein [Azospirillum agricola]SMH46608.1 PAS domain S-box-containing protein [Azospirillum lipoferum]